MFQSARLRLTLYYLAVIMALSILFSLVIYNLSSRSIRGSLRRQAAYFENLPRYDFDPNMSLQPDSQLQTAQHDLQFDLILVNLLILVAAGYGSYLMAQRTLAPIEDALDAQSRFTADASHELRTPLTAMKSEIEVALRGGKLSVAEARELLGSNLEEVIKLEALASGLLQLAQHDEAQSYDQPVELSEVVSEAVKRLEKPAKLNQITIDNQAGEVTVRGEATSLTELVVILIDNAVKYSSPKTAVTIRTVVTGTQVKLGISDQGQGIKASDLPHIFERFYRAESSRSKTKVGGYGLGLSIAQKIVENHGGSIDVDSTPGEGATFTVSLPLFKK